LKSLGCEAKKKLSVDLAAEQRIVDIGARFALLWYWWSFFRDARCDPPEKTAP
jgi:hypothetical protein